MDNSVDNTLSAVDLALMTNRQKKILADEVQIELIKRMMSPEMYELLKNHIIKEHFKDPNAKYYNPKNYEYIKKARAKNPEKYNAYMREFRKKQKEKKLLNGMKEKEIEVKIDELKKNLENIKLLKEQVKDGSKETVMDGGEGENK